MRKGQMFMVDLMLALVIVVLALALVTQAWSYHLQETSSVAQHAKMQQIAIDAASLEYYGWDYTPFGESAGQLGYEIRPNDNPASDCVKTSRGTEASPVEVYVCAA